MSDIKFELPNGWAIEVVENRETIILTIFSPYNEPIKFKSKTKCLKGERLHYLMRELSLIKSK